MLNTIVKDRGTGKTTEVIIRMKENKDLLLIIPVIAMKRFYPEELHERIGSIQNLLSGHFRGKKFSKVIIDEGFTYSKDKLAKLYYFLGENHIDVDPYGSLA